MHKEIHMEKLKICFVDYGIGKYYSYTDKGGRIHPVIEINKAMLEDPELFKWVMDHELEHYQFYRQPENWGKKNETAQEIKRLLSNPKMSIRLNKFERTHKDVYLRKFVAVEEEW